MTAIVVTFSILIIVLAAKKPLLAPINKFKIEPKLINEIFKIVCPSLILALIFGLRDNVGVDYPVYKDIYNQYFSIDFESTFDRTPVEWLFTFICWILKMLDLPYYWMFIIMAFIPMSFYMMFIKKYPSQALLSTYFLFACGIIFWYFNILRQGVAFFILLYSIKYIIERNFWKYLLWIVIAGGFHSSSYLFIIFYFIFNKPINIPTYFTLSLYIVSWCFSSIVLNILFSNVAGTILVGTPYAKYANNISLWEMGGGLGLGILSLHIVDLCIICLSKFIYNRFKSIRLDVYYNIFFIGTLIANVAGSNMLLSRIPFCMVSIRFFLSGCLIWYIKKHWASCDLTQKILGCGILAFSSAYLLGNLFYTDYTFII